MVSLIHDANNADYRSIIGHFATHNMSHVFIHGAFLADQATSFAGTTFQALGSGFGFSVLDFSLSGFGGGSLEVSGFKDLD